MRQFLSIPLFLSMVSLCIAQGSSDYPSDNTEASAKNNQGNLQDVLANHEIEMEPEVFC